MNYLIGCGGVGSWLVPSLLGLVKKEDLTVIDGDTLEEKNLDRQFFNASDVGKNKADAIAERYGCLALPQYYNVGLINHDSDDVLFVAVDNHPARLAALTQVDRCECSAIVGANESFSADAYIYASGFKDTRIDPRVQDPSMLIDHDGDPQRIAIGCVAQREARPQLVTANRTAAILMERLFILWFREFPKMKDPRKMFPHLCYKLRANLNGLETDKVGEL